MMNHTERSVWLVRHAKAAKAEPGQNDIDRPLTARGERQCVEMRDWLATRMRSDLDFTVLVSPAARTRRTAELVLGGRADKAIEEARIWDALAQTLAAMVQDCSGNLVLIGHNPGLEQVQAALTGQLMPLPTGGIFELEFGDQGRIRLTARFEPDAN